MGLTRDSFRAAVMTGAGAIEVRTFPRPRLEPGAVLMRVIYSGICGTDKHTCRGETANTSDAAREGGRLPAHLRAREVGDVLETGGEVLDSEGARADPATASCRRERACGRCYYCLNGFPYYSCERLEDYGNSLGATDRLTCSVAGPRRWSCCPHAALPRPG